MRRWKSRYLACRCDSGDRRRESARDPEIAVRTGCNRTRRIHSGKLGNLSVRSDPAEHVYRLFGEPDISIRAESHISGKRIRCRRMELRESPSPKIKAPDRMIGLIAEPDVTIRARSDPHTYAKERKLKLGNLSVRSDRPDLTSRSFPEPHIAVRTQGNECRIAQAWRADVADPALRCDPGNLAAV